MCLDGPRKSFLLENLGRLKGVQSGSNGLRTHVTDPLGVASKGAPAHCLGSSHGDTLTLSP